jgi:hypothetical protein
VSRRKVDQAPSRRLSLEHNKHSSVCMHAPRNVHKTLHMNSRKKKDLHMNVYSSTLFKCPKSSHGESRVFNNGEDGSSRTFMLRSTSPCIPPSCARLMTSLDPIYRTRSIDKVATESVQLDRSCFPIKLGMYVPRKKKKSVHTHAHDVMSVASCRSELVNLEQAAPAGRSPMVPSCGSCSTIGRDTQDRR